MGKDVAELSGGGGERRVVSEATLRRLPLYHRYIKELGQAGATGVSCTKIGGALSLDPTQVRKDVEVTGIVGRPKTGYEVGELAAAIEHFLGWDSAKEGFLVGVGSLGAALLGYHKFAEYGLEIVAAFDTDPAKVGKRIHGKYVLALEGLPKLVRRMHIAIGIITVPVGAAQEVADLLVEGGVRAIWNFAPTHLNVAPEMIVRNEDLYCSLAALSQKLRANVKGMKG
ncbi:MAG: redox-sensing transcriptional repressor Rex [Phycisphaerales bacterium]|nr:redox-sensing transcriptional repressor Rex [Phycisphaerales bacterium]